MVQSIIASTVQIQKKTVVEPLEPWEFWTLSGVVVLLVLVGGVFAGLTIGLMSLDATNLNILKRSGTPKEKKYAARIEPIKKDTHLLLVTLLLGNTIVNETLPVLFHVLQLDGWQAVLVSTALIVVFGEIIPQAACSRYGLEIGAFFVWPVRILMALEFVVAYPIAKLLDWILGKHHGIVYRRAELKELVAIHGEKAHGTLTQDEVSILRAVLDTRDKTVSDVMTKLEHVFMLPLDGHLDEKTFSELIKVGHSRVPIYHIHRENVLGLLLVKQLVLYEPNKATPISTVKMRRMPRVRWDTPLFEILRVFESGGSHMALVVKEMDETEPSSSTKEFINSSPLWVPAPNTTHTSPRAWKPIGIVTLEDVIEELIGQEIIDETDEYVDVGAKTRVDRDLQKTPSKLANEVTIDISDEEEEPLLGNAIYEETSKILSKMPLNPLSKQNSLLFNIVKESLRETPTKKEFISEEHKRSLRIKKKEFVSIDDLAQPLDSHLSEPL